MKPTTLSELRQLIRQVIAEEAASGSAMRTSPPPLPPEANQKPASAALPAKGALHKFRADVNMAADAASRAKEAVERAETKEALRWLSKVIGFATSAKGLLGEK